MSRQPIAKTAAPATADELMGFGPVIPALVIERAASAVPLGRTLLASGIRVMEVTLRTAAAIEAIGEMSSLDGAVVGAGTVLNARDVERAQKAGARFLVSPGLTESLAEAARACGLPLLPGAVTASEVMRGLDLGIDRFKFFPAETSGGAESVKALMGPFPHVRFCPTGGITAQTATRYLSLDNVGCVGGTWLAPRAAIAECNWALISRLAREAAALRG